MKRRIHTAGIISLLFALLCTGTNSAHADLQGCSSDADILGEKVVIGSLTELAGNVSPQRIDRVMLAAFKMRFDKADAELRTLAKVIYCADREMHESDSFNKSVTGALNDEEVLLEVGARLVGTDIVIAYVVIPLRHYEFFESRNPAVSGYHEALYEQARISAGLKELFHDNADLRLMAALALALRHEKISEVVVDPEQRKTLLHRSRAFYCDAIGSLELAQPRDQLLGLSDNDWEALGEFARSGAARLFDIIVTEFGVESTLPAVAAVRAGSGVESSTCADTPLAANND